MEGSVELVESPEEPLTDTTSKKREMGKETMEKKSSAMRKEL